MNQIPVLARYIDYIPSSSPLPLAPANTCLLSATSSPEPLNTVESSNLPLHAVLNSSTRDDLMAVKNRMMDNAVWWITFKTGHVNTKTDKYRNVEFRFHCEGCKDGGFYLFQR
jgi:hypothetical protein